MKKTIALILAILCAAAMFSACGATEADRAPEAYYDESMEMEPVVGLGDKYSNNVEDGDYISTESVSESLTDSPSGNTTSSLQLGKPDPSRKLIYNVNYTLETKTYDDSVAALLDLTATLGGYTESSDTRGGNGSERYSTYVLRIPSDKLQDFISSVGTIGSIRRESLSTQDITLEYVDVESRLASLRAQEARLIELLGQAKDLDEVLRIEESLANIRYEIESYTTRLNTMSSLVSYSTVTVELNEVIEYTPVERKPLTFGEKLAREFSNSIERVSDGFQSFVIWFLGNIVEILLVLALIAAVVLAHVLVIRLIIRRCRRKK